MLACCLGLQGYVQRKAYLQAVSEPGSEDVDVTSSFNVQTSEWSLQRLARDAEGYPGRGHMWGCYATVQRRRNMAENGVSLTVNVSVPVCTNIKVSRGDGSITSFIRVNFGGRCQCDTVKVSIVDDTAQYGPTVSSFDIQAASKALLLDELVHKPLVLSVIESVPKDKKAKEEKSNVLGQCIVDLMPFVRGETTISATKTVYPCTPQTEDSSDLPQLEVVVSLPSPIVTSGEVESANIVSVRVNSLYSLPDGWQPGGQPYNFTVSLPIPIGQSQETTIAFPNGSLKAGSDQEPSLRKWSYTGIATGQCVYKPDSVIEKVKYNDENGELRQPSDIPFRVEAENEKPRVTWNAERRCRLDSSTVQTLQSMIAQSRLWPVEVFRIPAPQAGGKSKKEEEIQPSYHGVAYVNLTPLLYPGVKSVRGAYPIQPYSESEVQEKTKRKCIGSTLEVALRSFSQAGTRNIASALRKGKRQSLAVSQTKHGLAATSLVVSEAGDSIPETAEPKSTWTEARSYIDAHTYISLEFCLDSPLIPKRPPEVLAGLVSQFIPPRSPLPRREVGADHAVHNFHMEVSSVATSVLEEFRVMFGEHMASDDLLHSPEGAAARRKQLLYELNTSGKYYQFKEQLKHAVVKVVREKFLRRAPITDEEELHSFLSQLYVYLTDEMHCSLSKTFSLEDPRPVPPPVTNTNFLKHFAREAEVNENYENAAKYYQERLAQDRQSLDHWYDYGRFCMMVQNYEKAQECFKEAVAIDQRNVPALVMYALVAAIEERHEIAETFFEAAASIEPQNVIVWTVMGLYYDRVGNDVNAEMAFLEAKRANIAKANEDSESTDMDDHSERQSETSHQSSVEAEQTTTVPAVETSPPNPVSDPRDQDSEKSTSLSPTQTRQTLPLGQITEESTIQQRMSVSPVASQLLTSTQAPVVVSQRSRTTSPIANVGESIFLQVAYFLLEMQATQWAEFALSHELLQPRGGHSSPYFMAIAYANMQKKNYVEAKANLNEALTFDYQNPDTWALLGHINYLTGKMEEARESYERVLDFIGEASDMHTVYLRLGSIYLQDKQFSGAKHTFLLACKRSPSCVTWLGTGIACFRMGELAEAEDALCEANILNNSDAEVWGYLALICLKTGRKVEAEQAYKYALKLDLNNDKLLAEIKAAQKEVGFGDPSVSYQSA